MNRYWLFFIYFFPISLNLFAMGNTELQGEIPEQLKTQLVHQDLHISYYFPETEDFGILADGEYIGILSGTALESGEVKVTISDHKIAAVEILDIILSNFAGRGGRKERIFEELPSLVIENQSPRVDTVSGATGTTHIFKICVTRALWQASEKDDPMIPYVPY